MEWNGEGPSVVVIQVQCNVACLTPSPPSAKLQTRSITQIKYGSCRNSVSPAPSHLLHDFSSRLSRQAHIIIFNLNS